MNYRAVPASLVHLSRKSLRLGYVPRYPVPGTRRPAPGARNYGAVCPLQSDAGYRASPEGGPEPRRRCQPQLRGHVLSGGRDCCHNM